MAAAAILQQQSVGCFDNHGQCIVLSTIGNDALARRDQQIGYGKGHAVSQTNLLQDIFKGRVRRFLLAEPLI